MYWYDMPMQVQYFTGREWSKGIIYEDHIIDLYSGQLWLIDEIYIEAEKMGIPEEAAIIEKCEWVNILEFLNS